MFTVYLLHFQAQIFLFTTVSLETCRDNFLELVTCRMIAKSIYAHLQPADGFISTSGSPWPGLYSFNVTLLKQPSASNSTVIQITMNLSTYFRTQRKSGKTPKRNVIFCATRSSSLSINFCKRSGFMKEHHKNLLQVLWITAEVRERVSVNKG